MGRIVAAFGVCHAPQLIWRPHDEDQQMLAASIQAMHELGKTLDETRPDVIVFLGSDHLETFTMTCMPTFAIIAGNRAIAEFAGRRWELPAHRELAEHFLDKLIRSGFDIAYSEDAVLGHTFAVPFEYLLEKRNIPVVPFFTNVYLPPLSTPTRCAELGKAIAEIIKGRPENVAIVASGGMSHYPGTSKYGQPEFEFDRWMIAEFERGNTNALLDLTVEQLDEVGNTEMLTWAIMLGAIGPQPGELLQYTATWHHGHGYMRFIPTGKRKEPLPASNLERYGGFHFKNKGFEFYKRAPASAYALNRLLFDVRTNPALHRHIIENLDAVGAEYGLDARQRKAAQALLDVAHATKISDFVPPLLEAGVHPMHAINSLHLIYSLSHKTGQGDGTPGKK